MRHIKVWLDAPSVGSGVRMLLVVREGRKIMHCLHIPTLSKVEVNIEDYERQLRRGIAQELEASRGLIGAIEERRKLFNEHAKRYPEAFVKEALAAIRDARDARTAPPQPDKDKYAWNDPTGIDIIPPPDAADCGLIEA